jgi:hypothetical protein
MNSTATKPESLIRFIERLSGRHRGEDAVDIY